MSFYSPQKIFCNACGVEMNELFPRVIGREFKVCSVACHEEIKWREVLSIMGKPYEPQQSRREDGNKET